MAGRIHLKHIIRPVKDALAKEGIKVEHLPQVYGDFMQVTFSMPEYKDCLKILIDTARVTKDMEEDIIEAIVNLLRYTHLNLWGLTANELAFMGQLPANKGARKFNGDISNVAYGLNEIGMIDLLNTGDGIWYAKMTDRGMEFYEKLWAAKL